MAETADTADTGDMAGTDTASQHIAADTRPRGPDIAADTQPQGPDTAARPPGGPKGTATGDTLADTKLTTCERVPVSLYSFGGRALSSLRALPRPRRRSR